MFKDDFLRNIDNFINFLSPKFVWVGVMLRILLFSVSPRNFNIIDRDINTITMLHK